MCLKLLLLLAFFVMPAAILTIHFDAQADPATPEEISHMTSGHKKIEGVVTNIKSGLYTVKTSAGTTYTLTESVAVRESRDLPQIGDEMILWINEGNIVMDTRKKWAPQMAPQFVSGKLISINYGRSQVTLSIAGQEENFKLRPESRSFRDFAIGTPITIAVNEAGEVIDLHVDSTSDVPRSGLSHPENGSALKGFRHLGKPE